MSPDRVAHLGATLNDRWGNLASDVPYVLNAAQPLVLGVQEAYRRDYRADLSQQWGVQQTREDEATAGVAVIFNRQLMHRAGRRDALPHQIGSGWAKLAKGEDTRMRGVGWCDLKFRRRVDHLGLPPRFRAASAHRQPVRDRDSWDEFDLALELWLHRSPLPTVVFMDANQHGGPDGLMHNIGTRFDWTGIGIDGCVSSFPVGSPIVVPRRTSDHDAVVMPLGVTTTNK